MNTVVAITITQAIIAKSENKNLKVLNLEKTSWTKSYSIEWDLLSGPLQLVSLPFLMEQRKKLASYIIVKFVEEHDIPSSLVIKFDQTPLKYAPVSSQTLANPG